MTGTSDGQGHTAREDHDPSIHPREVRPGMVVRNPYGGAHGRAVVASEPRERPDGAVEFDTADGRTGVFRPHFRLYLDRTATERLANERDAKRPSAPGGPPRTAELDMNPSTRAVAEPDTGRTTLGSTGDGKDVHAVTTDGRVTSLTEPQTGKAAAMGTQAVLDAIKNSQLGAEQLEGCDFWAAKAIEQQMQAEADTGPAERQLGDWNIHNDHADGLAADYDLDREA